MEKKEYVAPKMEQVVMELEQSIMAGSTPEQGGTGSRQNLDDESMPVVTSSSSSSSVWE